MSSEADLSLTGGARRIEQTEARLGEVIRAARSGARQGDMFTADIATAFRRRLTVVARDHAVNGCEW